MITIIIITIVIVIKLVTNTLIIAWWLHQMESFSAWLALCAGHRSPVSPPHKGQWRGALIFCLICAWINRWVNNREAGDLRHQCAHYDVTVMAIPARQCHQSYILINLIVVVVIMIPHYHNYQHHHCHYHHYYRRLSQQKRGPLFTKRWDVLLEDFARSRSGDIRLWICRVTLKFKRRLGNNATQTPVKF